MPAAPTKLKLKRDEKLTITWDDQTQTEISVRDLRKHCPCATCKELREKMSKSRLTVLPSSGDVGPIAVAEAKLVGGYALNVTWNDGHASGIYSFEFLRTLGKTAG